MKNGKWEYYWGGMGGKEMEKIASDRRNEWIDLFFNNVKEGSGIDRAVFEEGMKWLYVHILNKQMPEIIYCDSWNDWIKIIDKGKLYNVGECIRDSIDDTIENKVIKHINDSAYERVALRIWDFLENITHYSSGLPIKTIWSSMVRDVLNTFTDYLNEDATRMSQPLYRRVCDELHASHPHYLDIEDIGMTSIYDYLSYIGVFKFDDFEEYRKIVRCCALRLYTYEKCVFAVQPPVHISMDSSRRFHSTEGHAIRFRDGNGYYYIHGRFVPKWVFEDRDKITRKQILRTNNAELRAAIYEVLGHEKIMEILEAKTVHTSEIQHANGDVETVELLKTRDVFPEIEDQPFAWVKVTCPSTGTNYLLGVEPKHTNAAEAVASLSMFKENEYSFNFRT
jgi:hypothetical protein